jgi:thymidylate synthase (FAD)
MRLIDQHWEYESAPPNGDEILNAIEWAGRTCYKSEDRINTNSAVQFVANIIRRGHESVLEHISISVRIITDRGVTHELVRHRIAAYSQESTRYCNYAGKEIEFIRPVDFSITSDGLALLRDIEEYYNRLIEANFTPQQARYFLPNGLKTEIVVTFNLRQWRHFFRLRTSKAAHPQMRSLARSMLSDFRARIPVVFDDIFREVEDNIDAS